MNRKTEKAALRTLAVAFCVYIFYMAWANREIVEEQWESYCFGDISFEKFTGNVSDKLRTDLHNKDEYINLNGLFVRSIGQIMDNEVVRLNNGMLTVRTIEKRDMQGRADNVIELSRYLEEINIDFVYVQAPDKVDLEKTLLPEGIVNYGNENANELLDLLKEAKVEALDLRPYTSATAEMVEKYFYRTDHHWNPLGAFIGFQKITEYIQKRFPETEIDTGILNLQQWEVHKKEDWFLGSKGKRTGIYFGGIDDLMWITPDFDTEMSCAIPNDNLVYKGTFEEANIREEYYECDEPDYFRKHAYCVYIGGDKPLVQHRNDKASSDVKILIIKDSFTLPVQAFLSVEFREVDVIDLRHYTVTSLVNYIEKVKPDIVIMMLYPLSLGDDRLFAFGLDGKEN